MIYCACINKELLYRNYRNDIVAVKKFKLIAIKRYSKLTDISKILNNNQWSRIEWI